MTIWILALLLFGGLAAVGYQQGGIRVGISFIGILVAALVAGPLGKLVKPAVSALGVANPILIWVLPPFVAYLIVLSIFKIIAFMVHRKVDVYYKYKAGDLRLALWERLNARLGLCLSFLNGLAYLVLLSMVIYPFSYWTVQLASQDAERKDADPKIIKLFNRMGRDLQSTGLSRVARAIDPMPEIFYDAADLAGMLFQNALLEARLSRYPAFLSLAEKSEFQAIAQDKALTQARLERAPIRDILKFPSIQTIVKSPDMLRFIWGIVSPDLDDLMKFLKEGKSAKYTEEILGRWYFDVNGAMAAYRQKNPNTPSSKMQSIKIAIGNVYAKTMIVAAPDHQLVIKDFPQPKLNPGQLPTMELQTLKGKWKGEKGEYQLSFGNGEEREAKVETGRLFVTGEGERFALVFNPED